MSTSGGLSQERASWVGTFAEMTTFCGGDDGTGELSVGKENVSINEELC